MVKDIVDGEVSCIKISLPKIGPINSVLQRCGYGTLGVPTKTGLLQQQTWIVSISRPSKITVDQAVKQLKQTIMDFK